MRQKLSLALRSLALAALLGAGPLASAAPNPMEREGDVMPVAHPALSAPAGETALVGQVMTTEGEPLANVALRDGGVGTRTNEKGEFLLSGLTPGRSVLTIDGHHAGAKGDIDHGLFEVQIMAYPGKTTPLGYVSYLPKVDHSHDVAIASPTTAEVVVANPAIPGLELHIPKGAILTEPDGKPVTKVGITPIPLDRTPFPLAKNVDVPVFFYADPGGATITGADGEWTGMQVYYPNYRHALPKARGTFWRYDPFQQGWTSYGMGTVSADGSQVIPDRNARIYDLTGAMFSPQSQQPDKGGCGTAADPVDLASGNWVESVTDLSLADILPIAVRRTYSSGDFNNRSFGVGMSFAYDMYLFSNNQYQQVSVSLPSCVQIQYTRVQNGSNNFADAVFVTSVARNSAFYNSRMYYNSDGWNLVLQNGTVYVFGDVAPLQAIRDRYGNTVTITHANGQTGPATQISSPNGRFIALTYNSNSNITQARDSAGRTVSYTYDTSGRMQTVTDADGGVTTYGWDSGNRITTVTDPRSNVVITNTYDANNRVTKQTATDGGSYTFVYTGGSNGSFATETDVTDPLGAVRKVTFNANGSPLTDKLAFGTAQEEDFSATYDPATNLLSSATDALGRTTSYTYDTNGNVITITQLAGTPNALVTQLSYGPFNRLASVTDPLGHTTQFGLDRLGTVMSITDPLGHQSTLAYQTEPYVSQATDPLGNKTSLTYASGSLTSVTDALGRTSKVALDALGRVVSVSDPLGNVTNAVYDPLYGPSQLTEPKGEVTRIAYMTGGLLGSTTDARNNITSYTYDTKNRVTMRTDPLGKTDKITSYDGNNNVLTRIDRNGQTTTFTYDLLSRVTSASYADGSVVSYSYDLGNRLTQIQDSVGGTITRSYDGLNRLMSETTPQGTVSYTYDSGGHLSSMIVPGQATVSYSYDVAGRPTQITQGSAIVTLTFDADNRRTSLTLPNGIVANYSYDAASQLTGITYTPPSGPTLGNLLYSYDFGGNPTSRSGSLFQSVLPAAVTSGSYDAANRLNQWVTPGSTVSTTYDANGNLLNDGTRGYNWDARNRLTSVAGGASFSYDGVGRRQSRTVQGNAISYLYDDFDSVQEQSGGTVLANILNGLGVDERFTRNEGSSGSTYLTDELGSSVALVDGTGTVKTNYGYDPYGNTSVTGSANDNSYQYAGRQNDGTGLYYNRARYYNPAWGRFISEDPLGLAGGINRFAYVGGNPLRFRDPSGFGQFGATVGGEIGATIGGFFGGAGGTVVEPVGGTIVGGIEGEELGGLAGSIIGSAIEDALSQGKATGDAAGGARGAQQSSQDCDKGPKDGRPPNLAPEGADQGQALDAAKDASGIPLDEVPEFLPNYDGGTKAIPGSEILRFLDEEGNIVDIRHDYGGHDFPDNPTQNRGPHFNTQDGGHFDYVGPNDPFGPLRRR